MKKLLFLFSLFFASKAHAVNINGIDYDYLWNPYVHAQQYVTALSSTNANIIIATATTGGSFSSNTTYYWTADQHMDLNHSWYFGPAFMYGDVLGSFIIDNAGGAIDVNSTNLNVHSSILLDESDGIDFTSGDIGGPGSLYNSNFGMILSGAPNIYLNPSEGSNVVLTTGCIQFPDGTVQCSSPTAGGGGISTLSTLSPGASTFIYNQTALQTGATFYVSSGSIANVLAVFNSGGATESAITGTTSGGGSGSFKARIVGNGLTFPGATVLKVAQCVGGSCSDTNAKIQYTDSANGIVSSGLVMGNSSVVFPNSLGNGNLIIPSTGGVAGSGAIRFASSDNSKYVAIRSSFSYGSSFELSLPTGKGSSGQFLTSDGSGGMDWTTASSGGGSQIYPATGTPSFPLGLIASQITASTAIFTGSVTFTGAIVSSAANSGEYNLTIANKNASNYVWKIWEGTPGNYDGYLKFGINPTGINDFIFAFTSAGVPIFNTEVDIADGQSFGSASSGAIAHYVPFDGSTTASMVFRSKNSAPYTGLWNMFGYAYRGGLHTENILSAHLGDDVLAYPYLEVQANAKFDTGFTSTTGTITGLFNMSNSVATGNNQSASITASSGVVSGTMTTTGLVVSSEVISSRLNITGITSIVANSTGVVTISSVGAVVPLVQINTSSNVVVFTSSYTSFVSATPYAPLTLAQRGQVSVNGALVNLEGNETYEFDRGPLYDLTDIPDFTGLIPWAGFSVAFNNTANLQSIGAFGVIAVPGCFLGDTLIATPQGDRRIDSIRVGDQVYSRDEETRELFVNTVSTVDVHTTDHEYLIINGVMSVTLDHPLWLNDKWDKTYNIKIGDYLRDINDHKIWVYSIEDHKEPNAFEVVMPKDGENYTRPKRSLITYNLRMASPAKTLKNYFASGFMVHNKCPFLYAKDNTLAYSWIYQNTFLYQLDDPKKETFQRRSLKTFTNKFYIRELENETSHIKSLTLIAVTPRGEVPLAWKDRPVGEYVNTKQGQIIPVTFEDIPAETTQIILEADGYYDYLDSDTEISPDGAVNPIAQMGVK